MSKLIMTVDDLATLARAPAGIRIGYGSDAFQFGELSLPAKPGPFPLIINVHGGVWRAVFGVEQARAQAQAFAAAGFAVWNIEYRRVGQLGGGWPGTFQDVSAAADHVRALATQYALDLSRICLMGHSAGGQLALWLAGRARIPRDSELAMVDPVLVRGVVALAPASELPAMHELGAFDDIVGKLMGGAPAQVPERYAAVTPASLAPLGIRQIVIVGALDSIWAWHSHAYSAAAHAAREPDFQLRIIQSAGHFELIAPESDAWPAVLAAAREVLTA